MQKTVHLTGLALIAITLLGCPMDTSVPIQDPRANYIDLNLVGIWKNRDDQKLYTFTQYDDHTYMLSFTLSDGTPRYYYPFMSFVNNQSFFCVPFYDSYMEETRYALYGISTTNNGNTLHVRGLKNTYETSIRTSADLRTWILNNMYSNSFYSTDPSDSYTLDRY